MERSIAHIDMDTFFVSCERLVNSQLVGIPLIIGGGSDRSVVASCSYEARVYGVRAAMSLKEALWKCPNAKVVRGDMEMYSKYSHMVTDIISEQAPVFEKASVDEFYLDISGMDKFFGCYKWTNELTKKIRKESGLPLSFGLSTNKTVSKIATGEGKPEGKINIPALNIQEFLNPLSVRKIPLVGLEAYKKLSRMGIRKIQTLSQTPVDILQDHFGKNGIEISKRSRGIDNAPVQPDKERKSLSTEKTFETDTIDIVGIKNILIAMTEKLAFELRKEEWLVSVITVKIRYNNFDTHTKESKIAYTSCDHIINKKVSELFDKVYERRMRIRLIGIRFSGLVRGSYQINLFDDTTEDVALYQAIDHLKKRFGFNSVMRAAGMEDTNRSFQTGK